MTLGSQFPASSRDGACRRRPVPGHAQLPPEAVLLDKVKIAETLKPSSIDPVTLEDAKADAVTWTWNGVEYRGATASKAEFGKSPEKYAAAQKKDSTSAISCSRCPRCGARSPTR